MSVERIYNIKRIALLLALVLAVPAHAGLFDRDVVPLSTDALREKLHGQTLAISTKAAPLEVKSKGAAVGGFVLGFVLSSAMASGAGPRQGMSAQQHAQNMQELTRTAAQVSGGIANVTTNLLYAQASKSAGQQAKDGPMPWLAPQLKAAFEQAYGTRWQGGHAAGVSAPAELAQMRLDLGQSAWIIDFSMLSSDYELRYALSLTLTDVAAKAINKSAACTGVYDKKMPVDDWKKDDHQAVAAAAKEVAELCLDKFLAALDIPRARAAMNEASAESNDAAVAQAGTGPATEVSAQQAATDGVLQNVNQE